MDNPTFEHLVKQSVPDIELDKCAHINVGVHCHVIITTGRRVIKIPTGQQQLSLIRDEQETLEYLQQHISTHIARILNVIPSQEAPAGYIVEMEHAKGNELYPKDMEKYTESELKHLGQDIGKVFIELHAIQPPLSFKARHIPIPVIEEELSLMKQSVYWELLDDAQQQYLVSIYERALPYFQDEIIEVPIHNDFGMNHVFTEQHKLSAVIDWGSFQVGDPARDFRWAVGPRSIHPHCFTYALSTYLDCMKTDPSFLGRALYYNESKVIRMLSRSYQSGDMERFEEARKSIDVYRRDIGFLSDFTEGILK